MAFVQSQSNSVNSTVITRAFDADVTVGNCILVAARLDDETETLTIADDNGGVYHTVLGPLDSPTENNRTYLFLSKPHDAGATTVTVTPSAGTHNLSIIISEWSGRGPSEDAVWDWETTTTDHNITDSVTATDGADIAMFLLAGASLDGGTPGMNFTERLDTGNRYLQSRDNISAGEYTSGTVTSTTARPSMMMMVSLPPNPHIGFGAMTWGAEGSPTGYTTYDVSSLADTGAAGTFRDAVSAGARYITFSVGGTIKLTSDLSIKVNYLTIAGETAPSPGITFDQTGATSAQTDDYVLDIRATATVDTHDIIVRYTRNLGDGGHPNENADLWGTDGTTSGTGGGPGGHPEVYNIVFDHLTLDTGNDGAPDIFNNARNITLSNTWVRNTSHATNINGSAAQGTQRRNITVAHNLWNGKLRQPKYGRDTSIVNHVNNVHYGWGRDLAPPGTGSAGLDIEHVDADGEYPSVINVEGNIFHHVTGLPYGDGDDAITWDDTSVNTPNIYFNNNVLPGAEVDAISNSGRNTISAFADVADDTPQAVASTMHTGVGTQFRTASEQTDLDAIWDALGYEPAPLTDNYGGMSLRGAGR